MFASFTCICIEGRSSWSKEKKGLAYMGELGRGGTEGRLRPLRMAVRPEE